MPRHARDTTPVIRVSAYHGGGTVTYHSHGWYEALDFETGEYDRYTYNDNNEANYGPASRSATRSR